MGTLKSIIEAIKAIGGAIKIFDRYYREWKNSRIDKHYEEKKRRTGELTRQIEVEIEKEAPSDEVLRDLHRRMANLGSK